MLAKADTDLGATVLAQCGELIARAKKLVKTPVGTTDHAVAPSTAAAETAVEVSQPIGSRDPSEISVDSTPEAYYRKSLAKARDVLAKIKLPPPATLVNGVAVGTVPGTKLIAAGKPTAKSSEDLLPMGACSRCKAESGKLQPGPDNKPLCPECYYAESAASAGQGTSSSFVGAPMTTGQTEPGAVPAAPDGTNKADVSKTEAPLVVPVCAAASTAAPTAKRDASYHPWTSEVRLHKADQSEDERYVLGIVLEPEVEDAQHDIYSAEEIRKAAHDFMEHYGHIGLQHKGLIDGRVKILESYLSPADFTVGAEAVKKGTWLLAARVVDDALWADVKSGKLSGWSIGGSAVREPDDVANTIYAKIAA